SGEGTFYDAGLGSCGIVSSANDYIVAISHELMDSSFTANPNNNPYCGKSIRAYRDGKSVDVTVVDRCEGCAYNDLDFSNSAFEKLASFNEGRVGITWEWI
ncbi:Non-catalytic module family EXPN protein, partial [Nadsonia fulvescens var. elongata DSM 6958]